MSGLSTLRWPLTIATLMSGCYASHGAGGESDQHTTELAGDGLYGAAGSPGQIDPGLAGDAAEDGFSRAVLFEVSPTDGCINADRDMVIQGAHLHWGATVEIEYPHTGAVARLAPGENDVDGTGQPIYGWTDLTEMWFRTLPLDWDGMGDFASGYYLVAVTNPGMEPSNAVGMNLQFCDEGE